MDKRASRSAARWLITLSLTLLAVTGLAAQQTGTVTGRVTDNNGAPLPGVQVSVRGTELGALSNEQGRYLILRVPVGTRVVEALRLGYGQAEKTVTVPADGTVAADFQMTVEAIALEGIVAVGYGTQKKVNLTGSVAAASIETVDKLAVPTLNVALQGLAPGLQVFDGGHQPGHEQVNMLIRGRTTIDRLSGGNIANDASSAPLVLVDGVEGSISNVDIDDVASVSVLKDASSAAIYGSRAANGVILVTTKRGQARDKLQISYNGYVGMQDVTMFPQQVSIADHMRLTNLAYANACSVNPTCDPSQQGVGGGFKYSQGWIDSTLKHLDPLRYPSTNWIDEFYNPAPIQDHTLRVSGGNEAARFALSLGYMREDGMMPTTAADRYSARLNTDFRASEKLTGGFDLNASRRWDIVPYRNWESTFYLIHDTPPTFPARYPSDDPALAYGWSDTGRNPLAYAEQSGDIQVRRYQGVATGRLNYDIVPGWVQLQTLGSITWDYSNERRFQQQISWYDYFATQAAGGVYTKLRQRLQPNTIRWYDNTGQQNTLRALLDFGHTFKDVHDISGVLGVEQITQDAYNVYSRRDNAYNNDLRLISMGDANTDSNSGSTSEWGLQSAYGRLNYNYAGRYLLEGNFRYDGSSRFAEGNRWGFFPSFSAGWRISEENFFPFDWVNELKLRGSWGELGNQTVGLYSYYSSISLNSPYYFNNALVTGAAKTAIQNPNISWETTEATDFGFDAAFLENRLTVVGDYYYRKTRDILLNLPIPSLIGQSAPTQNAGMVENKGWEFELGWKDRKGEFNYGIDFNLSNNNNKVLDLRGTGPYINGEMVIQEGSPMNSWYGYRALGLFQNQAEIDGWANQNTEFTHPGDIKWEDVNGDGQITSDDRVIIGDPNPHYMFGINLTAGYKNFDLSVFGQGVGKRDQYVALGLAEGPVWENHISKWHLDYWTPDNPDARMPAYYLYQNYNTNRVSSWWILDGKYFKLRNVQLGYTLPATLAERFGVQRARVYVSGKNLWVKSYMGIDLDPEFPWVRGDYYPQTKVFSIGTDITF